MQTTENGSGQGVHLSMPPVPGGACSLNGNIWLLSKGSNSVTIRNARTGEVVSRVDLLDEGVAIAAVNGRAWVSTTANKVFVFDTEGTLLGALQTSTTPVKKFYSLPNGDLYTSNSGKDFTKWDTEQFTQERVFYGTVAGETVTDVVQASRSGSNVISSTTNSLRLWGSDGTCLADLREGASALVVANDVDGKDFVWAAQAGWITVFSIATTNASTQFIREKTLPASGVLQLTRTSPDHIASIDSEGLVTLWSTRTLTPQRTFRTIPPGGQKGSNPTLFTTRALETSTTVLWTIHDMRALIWTDEYAHHGSSLNGDTAKDLRKDEIDYLKRKVKFLEGMGTMYRQKAGMLFREQAHSEHAARGGNASGRVQAFNEIDSEYARAIATWDTDDGNHEPIPEISAQDVAAAGGDFTEYWKQKYKDTVTELEKMRAEHESIISLMHNAASASPTSTSGDGSLVVAGSQHHKDLEVKRAHHICQIIKEKNELKEHSRQLQEDVSKLRAKLREFNSPLASKGALEEDVNSVRQANEELRAEVTRLKAKMEADAAIIAENASSMKHNQILKQRVKKLRTDLDNVQIQLSEQSAAAQADMEGLLETISGLQAQLERQKNIAADAEVTKAAAELAVVQKQAVAERYQAIAEAAERELSQRDAVEKAANTEIRHEVEMLCQSLDDRDKRLAELLQRFNETSAMLKDKTAEASECRALAEARGIELDAQQQRIDQLEEIVLDRKNYGRVMGELQGRMEMLVEELRRSFTPTQFAENVDSLEARVGSLFSLEGQLRQKDDIIAIKDDEILRMKEHIERMNEQIGKVSSVFVHLPKSVEEVELLMVEVDEYRRRLGLDAETQEMIQIRLLELQAKRKAGEKIPATLDLPKIESGKGKSAAEMNRLKELADTMQSVARAAAAEDKAGLVSTPAPTGSREPQPLTQEGTL